MSEHFTRNTESVTAWCNRCNRMTEHRVDGGRKGPCLEHTAPVKATIPKFDPPQDQQKELFEK